jgi:esterase/lipase superfamily enzyme
MKCIAGIVTVLCAAALLAGCTFSDSLRNDPVQSVWGPQPGAAPSTMEKPVFFVTDRTPDDATWRYGLHWGMTAQCGDSVIKVPAAVTPPQPVTATLPTGTACDSTADMAAFVTRIKRAADGCGGKVLLLAHGYNTTFRSALLHAGQLAADTQWSCATVLFSWTSEGRFNRYVADVERSGYSVPLMIALVRELRRQNVTVNILAYSMGGRVAMSALSGLCVQAQADAATDNRLVQELLLAATDISSEPFNDDFGKFLARIAPCVSHVTLYASDYDIALGTSQGLHGGIARAGGAPLANLQYGGPQVDVVDASLAPGGEVGHSYALLSYEMARDMGDVLAGKSITARAPPHGNNLVCSDWKGGTCALGRGVYVLNVPEDRHPSWVTRTVRMLWPRVVPTH